MIAVPGPWLLSPTRDDVLISILPPMGLAPRHTSQPPLATLRGYTVGKFSSPMLAYQVGWFPHLVKLVDTILDFQRQRELEDDQSRELLAEQMRTLIQMADALRLKLGTTAEWPFDVKVMPNRWETAVPPFGVDHLAKLREAGLSDQVQMYEEWAERDPFKNILGVTW